MDNYFDNIQITTSYGRVKTCTVDGIEGVKICCDNRTVFKFGEEFVVKFDCGPMEDADDESGYQNQRELDNYKAIPEEDKHYFAEVYGSGVVCGYLYIVQEFAQNTARMDEDLEELFNEVQSKYGICDVWIDNTGPYHSNVAVHNNGFKFYDLGWEREFARG